MRHFFLIVYLLVSTSLQAQDPNKAVVLKLSEILKTPYPTKIEIEAVSQEHLQRTFRNKAFGDCLTQTNGNLPYCHMATQNIRMFIKGYWVPEKDPTHLHIVLYEQAGVDVLVHEFLHWWLHYQTNPAGILNDEATVERLVVSLMTSPAFIQWLGGDRG